MKKTLITSYVNADLDGVAGSFAYQEFLEKSGRDDFVFYVMGDIHNEAKYVLDRFSIKHPEIVSDSSDFQSVILVDTSVVSSLKGNIQIEKVIEIIDHRVSNDSKDFVNAKIQIEAVGAVATLIAEKFFENNISPSKDSAILLYGAIISNTLNFKNALTTERDIKMAKWLNTFANLPEDFWIDMFSAKSDMVGGKLKETIHGDFARLLIGGKKVGMGQIEMIGVEELLKEREGEVLDILNEIKKQNDFDYIFQNTIDLLEEKTFIVADDIFTKEILEKVLEKSFDGNILILPKMFLRKQIIPLLKKELEGF